MSEKDGEMVVLDDNLRGEIALKLLKRELKQKGIKLHQDMRRNLGNVAKDTGIREDVLMAFGKELVDEMVKDLFSKR